MDFGVSSTWNDNNEYEILSRNCLADMGGEAPCPAIDVKPLFGLLMMRSSMEAQQEYSDAAALRQTGSSGRPGDDDDEKDEDILSVVVRERPFLVSRAGCVGMHRLSAIQPMCFLPVFVIITTTPVIDTCKHGVETILQHGKQFVSICTWD